MAARAGFAGVEPWIEEIEASVAAGVSLADLRRQAGDLGLSIVGAVGFARWIVSDPREREAGLEHLKRDMELVAGIGGAHIACPPIGAHEPGSPRPTIDEIAARYVAILELGRQTGVTPIMELWGFSQTLGRLSELLAVAAEAGQPDTCLLLDSYHLYKGGSGFGGLPLLNGAALPVFHINDYPADPPREKIDDSHRVYPGDGVAPLGALFRTLQAIGFGGYLSVELFNPGYWRLPPETVAGEAIEKTRRAVRDAFATTRT